MKLKIISQQLAFLPIVFFILVLLIFIRLFVFEFYTIPSNSMRNTLHEGDIVVIHKLYYGPRLPQSFFEISWVNLLRYLNKDLKTRIDSNRWEYKRFKAMSKIERYNIIVFNSPNNYDELTIKRCVGLPGESIKYSEGEIFINSELNPQDNTNQVINNYRLKIKNIKKFYSFMDSIQSNSNQIKDSSSTTYYINLTIEELEKLKRLGCVDSIKIQPIQIANGSIFISKNSDLNESVNPIDSVWIPKKGEKIKMTLNNYNLYREIIRKFEGRVIHLDGTSFKENGVTIDSLTFKNNYYFMMGDNRNSSNDSRFIGFIPEQNIIGKATRIIFSYHENRIQWKRLLKKIY